MSTVQFDSKYEYKYWVTNLGDGGFDTDFDKPLAALLHDGWKPLRETPVGNGNVLFVLSRQIIDPSKP